MKVVINGCYGGFSLSDEAVKRLGLESAYGKISRTDATLVQMVEEDPEGTSGRFAELEVVEIPDNATDWMINEYDGMESITAVVDGKFWFDED